MESQVLHTVWRNISGEAAGEIWNWSLLGVKGFKASPLSTWRPLAISQLKAFAHTHGRCYYIDCNWMAVKTLLEVTWDENIRAITPISFNPWDRVRLLPTSDLRSTKWLDPGLRAIARFRFEYDAPWWEAKRRATGACPGCPAASSIPAWGAPLPESQVRTTKAEAHLCGTM